MNDKGWIALREDARERLTEWLNASLIVTESVKYLTVKMLESPSYAVFEMHMNNHLSHLQEPVKSEIKNLIVAFLFGVTVEVRDIDNDNGETGQR